MQNERKQKTFTARNLCYGALGTTLFCVGSFVAVPVGTIPFTLQVFAFCFVACFLGVKLSLLSTVAYLTLGAIGVPVFSGFTGGVDKLMTYTGGFLIGFLPFVWIVSSFAKSRKFWTRFFGSAVALLVFYTIGVVWFCIVGYNAVTIEGIISALSVCVLPFILADVMKIFLAIWLAEKLKKWI